MLPVYNKETDSHEIPVPATIKSVGTEQFKTKDKETPYVWVECEVVYPDETKGIVDALLWVASLESSAKEAFQATKPVTLTITTDGPNAGFAKVGLPTVRKINLSKFSIGTTAKDNVTEGEEVEAAV